MVLARRKSYPYNPLPHGDTFRYLILQPGNENDPLVCNIRSAVIAITDYDAVSYVWGTSVRDQRIECDGHDVEITANLAELLRRVRKPDKALVLWADSICIDQDNKRDKGHQVGLMDKIYLSARRVLIYIGLDFEGHGPALCSLLEYVDSMIHNICEDIDMSWDSFPYPEEDDSLLDDPRWDSLRALMSKSWFDRGWMVQEAALANEGKVIWGQSEFDWRKLMRVYMWLSTRGRRIFHDKDFGEVQINAHMNAYLETHKESSRAFYNDASWGKPSILRTLNCAKELDLSDDRDRIYAFMGLRQVTGQSMKIRPDYSAPYLETYHRFAIDHIRSSGAIDLLDFVSHDGESLSSGIPSWVPRWDIPTWSLSQPSLTSSRLLSRDESASEASITKDGHLKVQGVLADTVHHVSEAFDWDTTTSDTIRDIWEAVCASEIGTPYTVPPKSYMLDAFLDALSTGIHAGDYSQWRLARICFAIAAGLEPEDGDLDQFPGPDLTETWPETTHNDSDLMLEVRADSPIAETPQEQDDDHKIPESSPSVASAGSTPNLYFDLIRSRTHNRRFILTKRGYMGLAPMPVREGDTCGIIFGCQKPCILRQVGNGEDLTYMFLGSTTLLAKECSPAPVGGMAFCEFLGEGGGKDWTKWDVEERDIQLC